MIEFLKSSFVISIIQSISLIICSELGDKTFFSVALLSAKHNGLHVFLSATSALMLMTVLTAGTGMLLFKYIPAFVTRWVSIVLFFFFGIRLLIEAIQNKVKNGIQNDETSFMPLVSEAPEDIEVVDITTSRVLGGDDSPIQCETPSTTVDSMILEEENNEPLHVVAPGKHHYLPFLFNKIPPIFSKCFFLIMMAEWGDRSQIATLSIAATQNWIGVSIGASLGHALCTLLAVLGGKYTAIIISDRIVSFCGGFLFILFGVCKLIF